MMINVTQLVFYAFSALLIFSSIMVVVLKNTVRGALFLVLGFFASAVLWMLMEAEFLSLALIFVYVGAVMTLFLFVVMMLNLDTAPKRAGFVKFLPIGAMATALLVGLMIYVIGPQQFGLVKNAIVTPHGPDYSNVKEIGNVLYTQYFYAFEIAAVILVVAIISAISLAFRGRQNSKAQKLAKQHAAVAAERIYLTKLDDGK